MKAGAHTTSIASVPAGGPLKRDRERVNPEPKPEREETQAMSTSDIDPMRRRTLLGAVAAVASVPLANLVMSARLEAGACPVDVSGPAE